MFQAFWLALLLAFLSLGRVLGARFAKARREFLLCVEYAVLYSALLFLLMYDIGLMFYHLPQSRWLDPDFLEAHAAEQSNLLNLTQDETAKLIATTSLRPYPTMRWLSMLTPIAVALTWAICVWGTRQQAREIWKGASPDEEPNKLTPAQQARDLVVQIMALPMVYAVMSLASVIRMWQVIGHEFGDTVKRFNFAGKEEYVFEVYEANYHLADLYEAWALYHFGNLVMSIIRRKFETVRSHREYGAGTELLPDELNDGGSGSVQYGKADIERDRRALEDSMHTSVQRLTMQGVLSFVVCCTAQSIFGLTLPLLAWGARFMTPTMWESVERNQIRVHDFFLGMGAVASSAAISNIVQVEHIFHEQLLDFKPFWKFWGTKVLVSIAFLQTLIFQMPISPFREMSQVHTHLIYASMLCYECLAVGLLHTYAWNANEGWYDHAAVKRPSLSRFFRSPDASRRNGVEASNLGKASSAEEELPLEDEMY